MSIHQHNTPESILDAMAWQSVFRECKPSSTGPWLDIHFADQTLTIASAHTANGLDEKTSRALEQGLNGISTAHTDLTAADVEKALAAVNNGVTHKLPIGADLKLSSAPGLITIYLTELCRNSIHQWRSHAHAMYGRAVCREQLQALVNAIHAGTSPNATAEGAIIADKALGYLVNRLQDLNYLPTEVQAAIQG